MKPTTTPGNASGKVSMAVISRLPGTAWRTRNSPATLDSTSVASVTAADSTTVETRLPR